MNVHILGQPNLEGGVSLTFMAKFTPGKIILLWNLIYGNETFRHCRIIQFAYTWWIHYFQFNSRFNQALHIYCHNQYVPCYPCGASFVPRVDKDLFNLINCSFLYVPPYYIIFRSNTNHHYVYQVWLIIFCCYLFPGKQSCPDVNISKIQESIDSKRFRHSLVVGNKSAGQVLFYVFSIEHIVKHPTFEWILFILQRY